MDTYFTELKKLLQHQMGQNNERSNLNELIDILQEELDKSQEENTTARRDLDGLSRRSLSVESSSYLDLKEMNGKLIGEITKLKRDLDNLVKVHGVEKEQLNEQCRLREQELYTDLQVAQATTAMQIDEAEGALQAKLNSLEKKLNDSNAMNNHLNEEMSSLKQKHNQAINDVKRKLELAEEKLRVLSEEPAPVFNDHQMEHSLKYQPLEISLNKKETERNVDSPTVNPFKRHIPLYKSVASSNRIFDGAFKKARTVPPLMPCPSAAVQQNDYGSGRDQEKSVKKRKLYNPDCLDYLSEMNLYNE